MKVSVIASFDLDLPHTTATRGEVRDWLLYQLGGTGFLAGNNPLCEHGFEPLNVSVTLGASREETPC